MADDFLVAIDEAFTQSRARTAPRRVRESRFGDSDDVVESSHAMPSTRVEGIVARWPWVEILMVVQFLWGALLFIPGAQQYRAYVRALPYVISLAILMVHSLRRVPGRAPRPTAWLIAALIILALNIAHPTTPSTAGLVQVVFQLTIAAPLFWIYKSVRTRQLLERMITVVLAVNFLSAALGVLQVYFPERFMPPQLSTQLAADYVETLTYLGADGRVITRPPGLTDTPGGAAIAGALTAILAIGLSLRARSTRRLVMLLVMAGTGMAAIYLTQVRSVLLMTIVAGAGVGVLALWQGRLARAGLALAMGVVIVVGSFMWASSIGGAAVNDRFLSLKDQGALQAYREGRGHFLAYTIGELLEQFPLGAGVGRWGMINSNFGNPNEYGSAPIYVEIQLTGWLLDGGVPMWILYGGAVLLALLGALLKARPRGSPIPELAASVLAVLVFIAGMAMSGPVFNTQLGIVFWAFASALDGAVSENPAVRPPVLARPFGRPELAYSR